MTRAERFAAVSIPLGALVLGLKSLAWWVTGSAALYWCHASGWAGHDRNPANAFSTM